MADDPWIHEPFHLLDKALALEQDLRDLEEWGARQEHDLANLYEALVRKRYGRLWRPRRSFIPQRDVDAVVFDVKRRLVRFERLTMRQEHRLQHIIARGGGSVHWTRRFVARARELDAHENLYQHLARLERFFLYVHRWTSRQGELIDHWLTLLHTQRPAPLGSTDVTLLAQATEAARSRYETEAWWR